MPRDAGELEPDGALAGSNDEARRRYPIRLGDRGRRSERSEERFLFAVEMRVERQLPRDDERRHQHDPRAPVGRQAAREIERMLGLVAAEERHDDAPRPPHQRS